MRGVVLRTARGRTLHTFGASLERLADEAPLVHTHLSDVVALASQEAVELTVLVHGRALSG